MEKHEYGAYRKDTGEPVLGLIDLTKVNPRAKGARLFVMLFVDVPVLTEDEKLSDFDVRLFVHLAAKADKQNEIRLFQDEIASIFKVSQPRISRSLKRLREGNYLLTPRDGVIQLSPDFCWKDSIMSNIAAVKKKDGIVGG